MMNMSRFVASLAVSPERVFADATSIIFRRSVLLALKYDPDSSIPVYFIDGL
jgi:hypothetical protein